MTIKDKIAAMLGRKKLENTPESLVEKIEQLKKQSLAVKAVMQSEGFKVIKDYFKERERLAIERLKNCKPEDLVNLQKEISLINGMFNELNMVIARHDSVEAIEEMNSKLSRPNESEIPSPVR